MDSKSLIVGFVVGIALGALSLNAMQQAANKPAKEPVKTEAKKEQKMSDSNIVKMELEEGTVTIELYPDVAPNTVASFKKLIKKGFYDGLTFHRVIPGFMAQGGDPDGTGMGGPGFTLKAEFNHKKHVRGTVAMARSSDPDSAGSQFYICYAPQPHLDGQYTVFGQVIDGMEFVDKLHNGSIIKKMTLVEAGE
jgi:peptidylprolyl isomerase/peptidyl-prolyl cis-trans isomerase B (cyclophilin B)